MGNDVLNSNQFVCSSPNYNEYDIINAIHDGDNLEEEICETPTPSPTLNPTLIPTLKPTRLHLAQHLNHVMKILMDLIPKKLYNFIL